MEKSLQRVLQRNNKDQYTLTIPKHVVQILSWNDKDEVAFNFEQGKLFINKGEGQLTRRLQCTNKQQYILTIPKHLVLLLNWQDKCVIRFGFDSGKLSIVKENGVAN